MSVWDFRGEMVTRFEDHVLWQPDSNTSNIYITSTQDYILSYCRRFGFGFGFGVGFGFGFGFGLGPRVYITSTQDCILSYCRRRAPPAGEELGSCFTDSLT